LGLKAAPRWAGAEVLTRHKALTKKKVHDKHLGSSRGSQSIISVQKMSDDPFAHIFTYVIGKR
jgi:hypothetical protein